MNTNKELTELILKSNMKIVDIAKKSGVARATLYKIMSGSTCSTSVDTYKKICEALGVSQENNLSLKIPVVGTIPAGIPIEAIEDIIDYEELPSEMKKQGEFFGLKVRGDSMSPNIKDKDVLIVRKQEDAESGDICVVMVNGNDATVKRIKKDATGITLIPDNQNYNNMYYSNSEILSLPVRIIGKVVEIRRSL